jgi:thiosulfate dehydrogenase [quinone] large subunit
LGNPAWTQTGEALQGFWQRAVIIPDAPARPAIAFDWYRTFIQSLFDGGHYAWFAKLIVAGELLVGVALILGAFVGIAAFLGGFMNWNFMMAGTASINPVLFTLSVLLIVAWKSAGWWGLDRWLLPLLGTPWEPGRVFSGETVASHATDNG